MLAEANNCVLYSRVISSRGSILSQTIRSSLEVPVSKGAHSALKPGSCQLSLGHRFQEQAEGQFQVGQCFEGDLLHAFEQFAKGRVAGQTGAQQHRVAEPADQAFDFLQRTVGRAGGHADFFMA